MSWSDSSTHPETHEALCYNGSMFEVTLDNRYSDDLCRRDTICREEYTASWVRNKSITLFSQVEKQMKLLA